MRQKGREGGRKEVRKTLSLSWVQASKKCCDMVVPPQIRRTRGRQNEPGKKREEGGRLKGGRKEGDKGLRKRRCRMERVNSLDWAWPVLHNTEIQTYTKRDGDTNKIT